MSASKPYKEQDEQEQIDNAEREAHDNGICMGIPLCGYCIDDWEEYERAKSDKHGYYDSWGRWVK